MADSVSKNRADLCGSSIPDKNPKQAKDLKDMQNANRRLTFESKPVVDPLTTHRVNKENKNSTEHRNIHDTVECPQTTLECETNALVLAIRQKQIDDSKNTIGYKKYIEHVPRHERKKEHPKTPPMNLKYSLNAWHRLVINWRKSLHRWDSDSSNKNDEDDWYDSVIKSLREKLVEANPCRSSIPVENHSSDNDDALTSGSYSNL